MTGPVRQSGSTCVKAISWAESECDREGVRGRSRRRRPVLQLRLRPAHDQHEGDEGVQTAVRLTAAT